MSSKPKFTMKIIDNDNGNVRVMAYGPISSRMILCGISSLIDAMFEVGETNDGSELTLNDIINAIKEWYIIQKQKEGNED